MTIAFRCPQCQSPCTAPPEMAGRKAKCLKCTQVIVVPNPERDRWPPGMEPPGMKASAAVNSAPPKKAPPASPAPLDPVPRAPAAQPVTPTAPPQAVPATPVAKAVPIAPQAIPVSPPATPIAPQAVPVAAAVKRPQVPQAKPIVATVAETVSDDIDDLLAFERAAPPLAPARPPGDNPYQSPQAADAKARNSGREVRFGETLETAWRIYKANFGVCLAASILSTVALTASIAVLNFSVVKFADIVKQNEWQSVTLGTAVLFTFVTLFFAAIMFFSLGLVEFLLQIAKGREADFSRLIGAADLLFSGLGLLVLVILSLVVGFVLLVIPGVFVIFLFALAPIALVDRQEGAIDALATSARLASANLATVALLILLTGLGFGLLSAVTCGFGALITGPFQTLVMIVLYMRASGKRLGSD